ncbi:hypothetical protein D3C87_1653090 [compost metagenome]
MGGVGLLKQFVDIGWCIEVAQHHTLFHLATAVDIAHVTAGVRVYVYTAGNGSRGRKAQPFHCQHCCFRT